MILYYCPTENRRLSLPYWLHTKTVYLPADGYWTYISVLISTAGATTGQESSTCWSLTISRRKKERPDVEQLRWSGPMHYLIFSDQIWSLSKSCYSHIWEVCCIRPYLNSKTASTIAASIVYSKLDCCNSLYYNLPKSQINHLQQIQNCLAHTVVKDATSSHIIPILRSMSRNTTPSAPAPNTGPGYR